MTTRSTHLSARMLRCAVSVAVVLCAADALYAQSPPCAFPLAYPGDSANREAIAAWMAARATADGLPPELPVMAALVESGLSNASNGNADSVGFFQMRVGTWARGPYFGFPTQPELQMKWFLDQATAVRNAAIALGLRGFGESPDGFGRWIDSALRPLDLDRKSYQLKLAEARTLIAAGRALAASWPFEGTAPDDQAPRYTIGAWLATRAIAAGLPGELPVMAALVESGLRNLPSDGSTAGYFRIPEAVWNAGAYAGFPAKPELQAKWFIDQALVVKTQRIAEGNFFFGSDPSKWGEWIADVERPAEANRGRYQLRLEEARQLMVFGCASAAR